MLSPTPAPHNPVHRMSGVNMRRIVTIGTSGLLLCALLACLPAAREELDEHMSLSTNAVEVGYAASRAINSPKIGIPPKELAVIMAAAKAAGNKDKQALSAADDMIHSAYQALHSGNATKSQKNAMKKLRSHMGREGRKVSQTVKDAQKQLESESATKFSGLSPKALAKIRASAARAAQHDSVGLQQAVNDAKAAEHDLAKSKDAPKAAMSLIRQQTQANDDEVEAAISQAQQELGSDAGPFAT
mmetsp:Transcript_3602/g.8518  ORF Transcript_3602/g.8518 Transcript_3602/m.8518 type:complete len:244 (-) Transcript_3602:193-924(-)|eukprot:CAMPEP_0114568222 /NCGR_PEP_ID=MMETSP0114-20121206/15935_1 /TAXON_ID=31324 /ORGANISM="Goniomonas sp, Strain m" /LENGTH=243 /DNA_ID=CAMNT_0001754935 /DNA_START=9 /DNA_END=740 /DNA_ORIENTATION=+